jgi:hypothetical protein
MKNQINLTINNLDDTAKTFNTVATLIENILLYYATQEKEQELRAFILGLGVYSGSIMQLFGYTEEGFSDGEKTL